MDQPRRIAQHMYDNDPFSRWMGMEIQEVDHGYCRLGMAVRDEMTNGFGIAHGGITYSLADSALAFACNGHGRHTLSIETAISHCERVNAGDVLIAEAKEAHSSNSIARYTVVITNQDDVLVAHFHGTVYRTSKPWQL